MLATTSCPASWLSIGAKWIFIFIGWLGTKQTQESRCRMGIVLCAGKSTERIELLGLGSKVSTLLNISGSTPLIHREKRHSVTEIARTRIETD
jgi:hypothetical protein